MSRISGLRNDMNKRAFYKERKINNRCFDFLSKQNIIVPLIKGGSRHKNWCMAWVLNFLIRYFSNYYILHRSDLAAWAAPLDPRLLILDISETNYSTLLILSIYHLSIFKQKMFFLNKWSFMIGWTGSFEIFLLIEV